MCPWLGLVTKKLLLRNYFKCSQTQPEIKLKKNYESSLDMWRYEIGVHIHTNRRFIKNIDDFRENRTVQQNSSNETLLCIYKDPPWLKQRIY